MWCLLWVSWGIQRSPVELGQGTRQWRRWRGHSHELSGTRPGPSLVLRPGTSEQTQSPPFLALGRWQMSKWLLSNIGTTIGTTTDTNLLVTKELAERWWWLKCTLRQINYSLAPPKFSHLRPLLTCAPLDYHLTSTSLFKLYPPLPSTMPWSKI